MISPCPKAMFSTQHLSDNSSKMPVQTWMCNGRDPWINPAWTRLLQRLPATGRPCFAGCPLSNRGNRGQTHAWWIDTFARRCISRPKPALEIHPVAVQDRWAEPLFPEPRWHRRNRGTFRRRRSFLARTSVFPKIRIFLMAEFGARSSSGSSHCWFATDWPRCWRSGDGGPRARRLHRLHHDGYRGVQPPKTMEPSPFWPGTSGSLDALLFDTLAKGLWTVCPSVFCCLSGSTRGCSTRCRRKCCPCSSSWFGKLKTLFVRASRNHHSETFSL